MTHGVTVAGNPGPIRISEQIDYSIIRPVQHRVSWRGERLATISSFNSLANRTTEATYRQDGASATIETLFRDDETYTDIVEICFNGVQRDWWTAPVYAALTVGMRITVEGMLSRFQQYADEGHTAEEVADEFLAIKEDPDVSPALGDAFEEIFMNGTTYTALLPVVTWTRIVAPLWDIPYVILDIGKVFSTASLIGAMNAAGVDSSTIQFQIAEVTNTVAANEKQTLGWLKTGRRTTGSDGGGHYVQEFIFDSYPTTRYAFV